MSKSCLEELYKTSPRKIEHLPKDKEYYMIFEEYTYCQSTGYEKNGEIDSRVDYLMLNVVFTVKEIEDYIKKQVEETSSYGKKKFSFVKCLPMSYNISIETKVSVNV